MRSRMSARCWPWSATPSSSRRISPARPKPGCGRGGWWPMSLCCGFCAVRLWKSEGRSPRTEGSPKPKPELRPKRERSRRTAALRCATVRPVRRLSTSSTLNHLLWLLLPACASVLLLATTNKLCQDVAVIPFLWVVPLALYLLSFIICFDSPRWYVRLPVHAGAHRRPGRLVLGAVQRQRLVPLQAGGDLLRRALHLLHGLSRRALPAQARPAPSHRLLPDDRRGRRAGRRVRRRRRAAAVHGLLRTALGPVPLRAVVPARLRLRPESARAEARTGTDAGAGWPARWRSLVFGGLDRLLAWLPAHTQQPLPKGWFTGLRIGMWTVLVLLVASWIARRKFRSFQHWRFLTCAWLCLGVIGARRSPLEAGARLRQRAGLPVAQLLRRADGVRAREE